MAYNSSGSLTPAQTYQLGEYLFRLIVTYDSLEDITSIQCNATHGEEHAQTGIDLTGSRQVSKWRVEASDRSADIYATKHAEPLDTSPLRKPFASSASGEVETIYSGGTDGNVYKYFIGSGSGLMTIVYHGVRHITEIVASPSAGATFIKKVGSTTLDTFNINNQYTYDGKTVYWLMSEEQFAGYYVKNLSPRGNEGYIISDSVPASIAARIAWHMIYGDTSDEEFLIARFDIDVAEADGGTWDEPASTGDVSKTLNVSVTGALSGRHNDPLNDTSYAYTPADQDAATIYGSGGDGGYGGGGGAGASTVVIHTIATERAGSVEETAIAKRHGYGSGGGKGGTGAGGCILVYY